MQALAFLQNLSSWEIILIFLVVLLFFGAKRLPDLFRSFGKSLKEFKKATSDIEDDIRTAMDEEAEETKPSSPAAKTEATTDPKEVDASSGPEDAGSESESKEGDSRKGENDPEKDLKETTKS